MFIKFKRDGEVRCSIVLLDPHVTSPGQDEPPISRHELNASKTSGTREVDESAKQIYDRAKRAGRRRSAGII